MVRTRIIKVDPASPEIDKIREAAIILRGGGLVAFPTETVYGLAAMYNNPIAVGKVYDVKNRPRNKPFSVQVTRIETIKTLGGEINSSAEKLIKKFWPGPLTIILKKKNSKETIAFRMPDSRIATTLIDLSGFPIVAPSANVSGGRSPESARDVERFFDGKIEMILDGGPTRLGIESTIVDATKTSCRILRVGAISVEKIQSVV